MKLTKSQLKQIVKEAFTREEAQEVVDLVTNTIKPMKDDLSDRIDKIKMFDLHKLYQRSNELNGAVQSLEDSVLAINDRLSTKKPNRFADQEAEREWTAKPTTDTDAGGYRTNEELKEMVKEELESLLSERGFGEGEPAKDELSKKRDVYLEEEKPDDYSVTKQSNGFIRIRKMDSGLVGLYNSDGSYRSGDLKLPREKVKKLTNSVK